MIRLEPMPQREDSEEKGGYKGRDLPWRVRGSNQRLGAPILGSYTGGGGGAGWRTTETNDRAVGNLDL